MAVIEIEREVGTNMKFWWILVTVHKFTCHSTSTAKCNNNPYTYHFNGLQISLDNPDEVYSFQTCPAHQRAIHIGDAHQFCGIAGLY